MKKLIWFLPARRLRQNTERAIAQVEAILPTIEKQWLTAEELGLSQYSTIYNAIYFLLLLHYDFALLSYNHAVEIDERKQNLYARQLCALIHEALDDVPTIFGAPFREAAGTIPNGDNHIAEVSAVLKTLGTIRRQNQTQIAKVRHAVAAHRDHDVMRQLEVMRSIDSQWLMSVSSQLTEFVGRMAMPLTQLLLQMGDQNVIIKHLAART